MLARAGPSGRMAPVSSAALAVTAAVEAGQPAPAFALPSAKGDTVDYVQFPGLSHTIIGYASAPDALEDRGGMTEEPVVGCSATIEGNNIVIRISDNGKGVPAEVVPRLFEPFFTTKEPGKGTGLGLPVSLHLAETVGGTIVYSPRDRGGAVFSLQLPLAEKK